MCCLRSIQRIGWHGHVSNKDVLVGMPNMFSQRRLRWLGGLMICQLNVWLSNTKGHFYRVLVNGSRPPGRPHFLEKDVLKQVIQACETCISGSGHRSKQLEACKQVGIQISEKRGEDCWEERLKTKTVETRISSDKVRRQLLMQHLQQTLSLKFRTQQWELEMAIKNIYWKGAISIVFWDRRMPTITKIQKKTFIFIPSICKISRSELQINAEILK